MVGQQSPVRLSAAQDSFNSHISLCTPDVGVGAVKTGAATGAVGATTTGAVGATTVGAVGASATGAEGATAVGATAVGATGGMGAMGIGSLDGVKEGAEDGEVGTGASTSSETGDDDGTVDGDACSVVFVATGAVLFPSNRAELGTMEGATFGIVVIFV